MKGEGRTDFWTFRKDQFAPFQAIVFVWRRVTVAFKFQLSSGS